MTTLEEKRHADTPGRRRPGGRGVADPRIRSVFGTALGTYRRRFGAIALAAVAIFVPLDLLLLPVTTLMQRYGDARDAKSLLLLSASAAAGIVASLIGVTIFAGVIEALVAADQEGREVPILAAVRRLPLLRLVLAGVLTSVLVFAGAIALFVPGLVILVLLSIVGPLIAVERIGIWAAMRRSTKLVSRHIVLVVVTVTIPFILEDAPVRLLERITSLETPLASVSLDVLTSVVLGGLVGVLEVTLVHALLAQEQRRRAEAGQDPAAGERPHAVVV